MMVRYSPYIQSIEVINDLNDDFQFQGMMIRVPQREHKVKVVLEIPYSELRLCDGRWMGEQVRIFVDTKFELPEELFRIEQ